MHPDVKHDSWQSLSPRAARSVCRTGQYWTWSAAYSVAQLSYTGPCSGSQCTVCICQGSLGLAAVRLEGMALSALQASQGANL